MCIYIFIYMIWCFLLIIIIFLINKVMYFPLRAWNAQSAIWHLPCVFYTMHLFVWLFRCKQLHVWGCGEHGISYFTTHPTPHFLSLLNKSCLDSRGVRTTRREVKKKFHIRTVREDIKDYEKKRKEKERKTQHNTTQQPHNIYIYSLLKNCVAILEYQK